MFELNCNELNAMNKLISILLLVVCLIPFENGWAQNTKETGEQVLVTPLSPENAVVISSDELNCKLFKGGVLLDGQPCTVWTQNSYATALEAAKVDPGILIYNDFNVSAKTQSIKPKGTVDPLIIIDLSKDGSNKR